MGDNSDFMDGTRRVSIDGLVPVARPRAQPAPGLLQPALLSMAIVGVEPVSIDTANDLLVRWEHRLGPVHRPFRQEAYVLMVQDRPVSVATSGSIIHGPVAGYELGEVVELTRLASDPANRWATRPMLRLWREVCAQLWPCWPVKAAISYSHNGLHTGDLYRWDGWTRAATSSGSTGGGQWSRPRAADDPRLGSKSVWVWRYDRPAPLPVAVGTAATLGLDVARMALEGQA